MVDKKRIANEARKAQHRLLKAAIRKRSAPGKIGKMEMQRRRGDDATADGREIPGIEKRW